MLTRETDEEKAAVRLIKAGVKHVVIKCGGDGCLVASGEDAAHRELFRVPAVPGVRCVCLLYTSYPDALVDKVEIDAGKLRVGDTVHVKDLDIARNPKIEIQTDPEAVIVRVQEVYNTAEEDAEGEEA